MIKYFFVFWMVAYMPMAIAGGGLEIGQEFPGIGLSSPIEPVDTDYLGLPGEKEQFLLGDIEGDLVVVEFFSMYCPHCQHEAPVMNNVFERLRADGLEARVKMIGIGIGNSAYEVSIFKKKFSIPFPLFEDENFIWHGEVGQVGTPYFAFVSLGKDSPRVVFTHLGRLDSAAWVVKRIREHL
jgi:thiol-disulfide isomerase/thioredoxin